MKRGDLVAWKLHFEMDIPSEVGLIVERLTPSHDPWPHWKVLFPEKGVLQCRESDLLVIQ